ARGSRLPRRRHNEIIDAGERGWTPTGHGLGTRGDHVGSKAENVAQHVRSHDGEGALQRSHGCVSWYRNGALRNDRSGVQPVIHVVKGDAGHAQVSAKRPEDGFGASPLREKRGVNIDAGMPGKYADRSWYPPGETRYRDEVAIQTRKDGEKRL